MHAGVLLLFVEVLAGQVYLFFFCPFNLRPQVQSSPPCRSAPTQWHRSGDTETLPHPPNHPSIVNLMLRCPTIV